MKTLALVWTCLLLAIPCSADIIYVKEGGTGGGTSWADAYGDLQDGLSDADPCDVIWVAEGIYYPTSDHGLGIGDRGRHFRMKNVVGIYGGFGATGDPDMENRDPNMYETILSGDLLGNDNPATPVEDLVDDPTRADNCYHVFYHPQGTNLDATAILDGFTITTGNANGAYPHNAGGGMFNDDNSSPTVTNCTFTGNSTDWGGGGMYNYDHSSPTVTGCVFTGNLAYDFGGGMANGWNSSPTVTNCTFTGNSSTYTNGGGMANSFNSPTVTNCAFTGNSADNWGGGMSNYDSNPTVTGCTFTGNSADNWGGGMYNYRDSNPTVISCTFTGNLAKLEGGGMYNEYDSSPTITNCIIWGNTATNGNEIYNYADIKHPSTPIISYCDIAGSGGSGSWDSHLGTDGGGNIDADPLFIDADGIDNTPGTEDDNLRLLADSPCIDTGDNSVVEPNSTDLDGNPRIINGIVDMGAYEALGPIEVDVHIVPRTINRRSRMKMVMAIIRLPEGINKADVSDEPFEMYVGEVDGEPIEASWQRVIGWRRRASVFALFDKAELMDAVPNNGRIELTVVGRLKSDQYIYGFDTVRIIRPHRQRMRLRRGR